MEGKPRGMEGAGPGPACELEGSAGTAPGQRPGKAGGPTSGPRQQGRARGGLAPDVEVGRPARGRSDGRTDGPAGRTHHELDGLVLNHRVGLHGGPGGPASLSPRSSERPGRRRRRRRRQRRRRLSHPLSLPARPGRRQLRPPPRRTQYAERGLQLPAGAAGPRRALWERESDNRPLSSGCSKRNSVRKAALNCECETCRPKELRALSK